MAKNDEDKKRAMFEEAVKIAARTGRLVEKVTKGLKVEEGIAQGGVLEAIRLSLVNPEATYEEVGTLFAQQAEKGDGAARTFQDALMEERLSYVADVYDRAERSGISDSVGIVQFNCGFSSREEAQRAVDKVLELRGQNAGIPQQQTDEEGSFEEGDNAAHEESAEAYA